MTRRSLVRIGVGATLLVLLLGGASWWFLASQQSGRSTGGVSVSADAAAGTAASVSFESAGVPEIEPLIVAGDLDDASAALQEGERAVLQVGEKVDPGADEEGEKEAPAPVEPGPASGESYTWHDGDRALVVRLQPDLVVRSEGEGISRDDIVPVGDQGDFAAVQGEADGVEVEPRKDRPVFRSDEGELMALPGGVVLVLDPGWDEAAVDAFFERNGIASRRTTALDYVTNGFFIETEPGFASLNLANALVGLDGVVLSSPNWWKEVVAD